MYKFEKDMLFDKLTNTWWGIFLLNGGVLAAILLVIWLILQIFT